MRRLMNFASVLSALAGCTLATDAGDRTLVDDMDLSFTLIGMSGPHTAGETLDVAVVDVQPGNQFALRGRARVILPKPPQAMLSNERIEMKRVLPDGAHTRALFYVDSNNDYVFETGEHVWQEDIPSSGELSFRHANMFQAFAENDIMKIGGDVVFELPLLAGTIFGTACFNARVQSTFEIAVFFDPNGQNIQVGYFKTYRDNGVPGQIRLNGIADVGETHGIQVTVDGVAGPVIDVGTADPRDGLKIPFSKWFPVEGAGVACTGM